MSGRRERDNYDQRIGLVDRRNNPTTREWVAVELAKFQGETSGADWITKTRSFLAGVRVGLRK